MAFTGQLGVADAQLGLSLQLGAGAVVVIGVSLPTANRLFFPNGASATHNYVERASSNTLGWNAAQGVGYNQQHDITQYLGWTCRSFHPAANSLGWNNGQRVGDSYAFPSFNEFGIVCKGTKVDPASNSLSLDQTATHTQQEDTSNSLSLDDALDYSATSQTEPSSSGFIKQHVTFSVSGGSGDCGDKAYDPHVGSSEDTTYTAPSGTAPTLGSGTLTLTYPPMSPTHMLTLDNPSFGNTDSVQYTRIDRVTRGGERKIYTDSTWGKVETLRFTKSNVCLLTAEQIVDFINTSLGKEINLLDWEGRNWRGVIVEPDTDVTEDAGGHEVIITFEGALV